MLHQLSDHLQNNWHKYGILLLLLKEFRVLFHVIDKIKNVQENWAWLKDKLSCFYQKITKRP